MKKPNKTNKKKKLSRKEQKKKLVEELSKIKVDSKRLEGN
jgi:hypothetical protein